MHHTKHSSPSISSSIRTSVCKQVHRFIPHITDLILCARKFEDVHVLHPPHPFVHFRQAYLWFLVPGQAWKRCSISLLRQLWISNGCQCWPGARWDHSGTTRARAKSLACLPKVVGAWVVPPLLQFIFNLVFHKECYFDQEWQWLMRWYTHLLWFKKKFCCDSVGSEHHELDVGNKIIEKEKNWWNGFLFGVKKSTGGYCS